MQITIYDKVGELESTHEYHGTLLDFIKEQAGEHYDPDMMPFSVVADGRQLQKDELGKVYSQVVMTLEPEGTGIIVAIVIALISAAYAYYVTSNIDNDYADPEQPNSIYKSNLRANRAKSNQIIREVAGSIPIIPDYAAPPRRFYEDNIEYIDLFLCVGMGYFDFTAANIRVADTPIASYAGDISAEIFEPGDDVSGNPASQGFYRARDVSSLTLQSAFDQPNGDWEAVFSNANTIQWFTNGVAASFPFDAGAIIQVTSANDSDNLGFIRIDSVSTTTATDDTTAITVMEPRQVIVGYETVVEDSGGEDEQFYQVPVRQTEYFETAGQLSTDVQNTLEWGAVRGGINWEGPFTVMPAGETTDLLEVDIRFPRGIGRLNNNGSFGNRSVEIAIQYRDSATGGAWSTVPGTTYAGATNDELAFTVQQVINNYNPEVRFRRVTRDFEESNELGEVQIQRVKGRMVSPTSYPKTTMVAIRARSTRALSRTAENQISIVGATRKLPTIAEIRDKAENGTDWDLRAVTTRLNDFYAVNDLAVEASTSYPGFLGRNIGSAQWAKPFFSDDGTRFVLSELTVNLSNLGVDDEIVLRSYGLTHRFDISAITFQNPASSASFSATNVYGFFDSGNRLLTSKGSVVSAYSMSTARDVSTLNTTATETFNAAATGLNTLQAAFVFGSRLYIAFSVAAGSVVRQYTMSTSDRIDTASYDNVEYSVSGQISDLWVSNDALVYSFSGLVTRIDIINGDLSTAINNNKLSQLQTNQQYMQFDETGSKMYMVDLPGVTESEIELFQYDAYLTGDTRATKDIGRFAAHMLYDRIGDDLFDFVDWDELEALDATLSARGDELNGEFAESSTLYEVLKLILAPGYAEPTVKDGRLTPVRTSAGTSYSHIYTPDIMFGDGVVTTQNHDATEEPDGIIVEYLNAETGNQDAVNAFLPGDQGLRAKTIQAFGISDRTRAWRYGMRERMRYRVKPGEIKFGTELDGLNSYFGDPIGVVDELDSPQFGKMTGVNGSVVSTDQELTFSGSDIAFFRDDEGVSHGPFDVSPAAASNELTLDNPTSLSFTFDVTERDVLFSMGTIEQVVKRAIVRNIAVNSDKTCDIICEEYRPEIYQYDDQEAPN